MAQPDTAAAPEPGEVAYIAGRLPIVSSAGAAQRAAELLLWQQAEIEAQREYVRNLQGALGIKADQR